MSHYITVWCHVKCCHFLSVIIAHIFHGTVFASIIVHLCLLVTFNVSSTVSVILSFESWSCKYYLVVIDLISHACCSTFCYFCCFLSSSLISCMISCGGCCLLCPLFYSRSMVHCLLVKLQQLTL